MLEIKTDLDVMVRAAQAGGALALRFAADSFKSWDKAPGDPVTEADLAVNQLLKDRLTSHKPDYGWLSEECADDQIRLGKKRLWVVDPIDGTRAFIKGRPEYVVSIALVENGESIAACLYDPNRRALYTAMKGEGAQLNGRLIQVEDRKELEGAKLVAADDVLRSKLWPEPWPRMETDNPNSIALRLALIAEAARHAAFTLRPKSDWDLAAASLILEEAGGLVRNHEGKRLRFNQARPLHPNLIASCPSLYDDILNRVRAGWHVLQKRRE